MYDDRSKIHSDWCHKLERFNKGLKISKAEELSEQLIERKIKLEEKEDDRNFKR